jgi:GNAT superfamily N-acetyltransferase
MAGDGARLRDPPSVVQDAPDAFATTLDETAAWPAETWNRHLAERPTFVATADDSDVGLVRGALNDQARNSGVLDLHTGGPEARRQGIASALSDAVVEWARAQGLTRVLLDVGEANTPAIALYTRKGFDPRRRRHAPTPRNHIRQIQLGMTRSLSP